MGDSFRIIVDPFASAEKAPSLAKRVIQHLIDHKIIHPERTNCTLNRNGGYAPGENAHITVADPDYVRKYRPSGVVDIVGRTVFHNFGAGLDVVRCPLCLSNRVKGDWGEAIGKWLKGDALAAYRCEFELCKQSTPIAQWLFDPPWAFGNLGFEFWNWPPFRREFVEEISELLGHKVVMVAGKV